ncbi:MAG: hypothetical protein H0T75_00040 [Rhizobiales bacterium]|nr:hypothetical protein [Hyphomicrobiales bacterium]
MPANQGQAFPSVFTPQKENAFFPFFQCGVHGRPHFFLTDLSTLQVECDLAFPPGPLRRREHYRIDIDSHRGGNPGSFTVSLTRELSHSPLHYHLRRSDQIGDLKRNNHR